MLQLFFFSLLLLLLFLGAADIHISVIISCIRGVKPLAFSLRSLHDYDGLSEWRRGKSDVRN
jgi:hypothetical protein